MFIVHKNRNKPNIQPILKSNSTSFMFNNISCDMKGKKVIHWGEPGGTVRIASWKCNLLGYSSILLGYPSNNRIFMPSIGSWCVIIHVSIIHVIYNALLKSDVSGHPKAYSSHSFQPTGIRLGSL